MHFFFSWVEDSAVFDPQWHCVSTEPIFYLEIQENEGAFPSARVVIQNPREGLLSAHRHQRAFIVAQQETGHNKLLFAGRVLGVPSRVEGEMLEIMLTAEPNDAALQLQQLHHSLKVPPYWDPLFVSESEQDDFSESLDARAALPYWSRIGEPVRLSDLFWGSQQFALDDRFFRDKLDFHLNESPVTAVHMKLKAEWLQQYRGRTNISYFLRIQFPKGLVNTFSGKDLEQKWWQAGEQLGRTTYWIEESKLEEIPARYTGALGFYPAFKKFLLSPKDPLNKSGKPLSVVLKRSWYRAKVVLGWFYRQKRTETLTFTLRSKLQLYQRHPGRTRCIKINLQPFASQAAEHTLWKPHVLYREGDEVQYAGRYFEAIRSHFSSQQFGADQHHWRELQQQRPEDIQSHQASFFVTPRGHQAIEHALEIARAHLAASARAVEIRLQAPFDEVMTLTCDHSVKIVDDRLPGGQVWGKVKSLRLVVDGATGRLWGELLLGVGIGYATERESSYPRDDQTLAEAYCLEDYCDKDVWSVLSPQRVTVSGIAYESCAAHGPTAGILYPDQLSAYDIVEMAKIINGPEEQEVALENGQYPLRHSLNAVLKAAKTDIILRLRDLRPQPKLKHTINLNLLNTWTAPKQIDLEAPQPVTIEGV